MPLSSELQAEAPHWASGCESCQCGLVVAPEIIPALGLGEQRAVQMDEGMIEFCECRAGFMYRQYLRKTLNALGMETRRNIHTHVTAVRVPTIHMAGEPA